MSPSPNLSLSVHPPAIAPHLLHSPAHSPSVDLQHFMDAYSDTALNPPLSHCYPSSPESDSTHPPAAIPESIASPHGMLVVHSYGPAAAPPGASLTVQVDFRNLSCNNVRLRIVFGDLALPTAVSPNEQHETELATGEQGDWRLTIKVPQIGQASDHMAKLDLQGRLEWPLTLQALDSNGNLLDAIGFGLFVYDDFRLSGTPSPPNARYDYNPRPRSPNKRSREDDDTNSPTPPKRMAMDSVDLRRMSVSSAGSSFASSQQDPTPNRTFIDGPSVPAHALQPGMSLSPHAFHHHVQPQVPSHSRHLSLGSISGPAAAENYSDESPALVRTSQLSHNTRPAQANVDIAGDLDSMKQGWDEAEYIVGRRLVQFWKRQVGPTLHITFAAIPQHKYVENTIVISCIYRENLNECFITSVDVIYLLEALAGNRFEVEEKNRIRRNLEGFKPMTVSKSKPGTEEFFKAIMEFAPPRPRNIEKDVKVFEWGKLRMMIEKVFSKYSTVPLPHNPLSCAYESSATAPAEMFYAFSKDTPTSPAESPRLPIPPSSPTRSQRRRSPAPSTRPHSDTPVPAQYSMSNLVTHPYSEHFLPAKYEDSIEYDAALDTADYPFSGIRFPGIPLDPEMNSALLKVDMAFGSGTVVGPATGRQLEGFRSTSPLSSDNSPLSMTLSLSSGNSSDAGVVETQDVTGISIGDRETLT